MKKYFVILVILFTVIACKKVKFSPEGPTDVRVRNLTNLTFYEVIVNTSGGENILGDIAPGSESEYFRFDKAFPKAEIWATINNEEFYTGPVNYTYMQYLGQDKITYEVYISNMDNKVLAIGDVIHDEPINP